MYDLPFLELQCFLLSICRCIGKCRGIEVFFKVCKSYLKLSKESRSLSYDALTAHVSIVFTRYMMLAVQARECVDDRSLGELFFMSIDELADITLSTSLTLILLEFVRKIDHSEPADSEMLADLVKTFIKSIPELLQREKSVHASDISSAA